MKKLLLAAALLTLIPVMARAANFYQWPGIWFMANPPETYSMVIITTTGTQCPGRGPGTHVTVGFDGHQGTPVYSCRSVGVSQTWDYHPRFRQADVGSHTITVTVGDTATTHSFGVPMAAPVAIPETPSVVLLPLVAIAAAGVLLVWRSRRQAPGIPRR